MASKKQTKGKVIATKSKPSFWRPHLSLSPTSFSSTDASG
uniref:Uncharacterized protein n=1 Tax=Setaria italica TaxID=4555 RepID=K3Y4G5_SETIT